MEGKEKRKGVLFVGKTTSTRITYPDRKGKKRGGILNSCKCTGGRKGLITLSASKEKEKKSKPLSSTKKGREEHLGKKPIKQKEAVLFPVMQQKKKRKG